MFRVYFQGDPIPPEAFDGSKVVFEGGQMSRGADPRHRALVPASSAEEAVVLVRQAVEPHGAYVGFQAAVATDSRGEPHTAPVRRAWEDIDWARLDEPLTALQRDLIGDLMTAGEPTWILLDERERDRAGVEAALRDLERRGLVRGTVEVGGAPGRADELDTWWDLTDEAWDMLAVIQPPPWPRR